MLRYDIFYLTSTLLASPLLAARLLRGGKWRTDWRARFGHVPPLDAGPSGFPAATDPAPPDPPGAAAGPVGLSADTSSDRADASAGFSLRGPPRPTPSPLPTVLVHGVSVGEVAATRKLVEELARRARVVVSSTTDTGVERARSLYGARHPVVRYPFDLSWMVRRFLDTLRPDVVALAELEVWPNFVTECTRRCIPVCVVNGRLSASSHRGYRRARRWVRPVFRQLAAVGAQNEVYARRFVDLGTPPDRVHVTDTMKWDTSGRPRSGPSAAALAAALGIDRTRPLIVAGSTGPGEEEELIAARPPAAQLLLVPRKPERFDAVAALHPGIRRRSRANDQAGATHPAAAALHHAGDGTSGHLPTDLARHPPTDLPGHAPTDLARRHRPSWPPPTDLFLLDTMGELELAYALADVAIVGRSFTPMGGSDPIPPVAAGCATIIGPHHEHFAEVVSALRAGGGLVVTSSPMEAAARLLDDADARRRMARNGQLIIEEHRGASARSAELVLRLLEPRAKGSL